MYSPLTFRFTEKILFIRCKDNGYKQCIGDPGNFINGKMYNLIHTFWHEIIFGIHGMSMTLL